MDARHAVVDGANIAFEERSKGGRKPRVSNLIAVRGALEERGFRVTVIVDASLIHEIDDPQQLDALIERGEIRQVPAGTSADYYVLAYAAEKEAVVVSNDRFRQWREEFPWADERRVPVMIVDGSVQLYEPKLVEILGAG